jgi:hypothetical protein
MVDGLQVGFDLDDGHICTFDEFGFINLALAFE